MYRSGLGVTADNDKAKKYYKEAADKGDSVAQMMLDVLENPDDVLQQLDELINDLQSMQNELDRQ